MTLLRDRLPPALDYFESRGVTVLDRRGKWRSARCPFCDSSRGLRINTETGGWICMACAEHGGDVLAFEMQHMHVNFIAAARVLGAWQDDPNDHKVRHRPLGFSARDGLEVLQQEAQLAAVAAGNLARGVDLTEEDRKRLRQACGRITRIREAVAS